MTNDQFDELVLSVKRTNDTINRLIIEVEDLGVWIIVGCGLIALAISIGSCFNTIK